MHYKFSLFDTVLLCNMVLLSNLLKSMMALGAVRNLGALYHFGPLGDGHIRHVIVKTSVFGLKKCGS